MEFCTKCGNKLEEHWLICPNCGNKIKRLEIKEPKQEEIISEQETVIPHQIVSIDKNVNKIKEGRKRTARNKKTLILSISLVVVCLLSGVLGILLITKNNKYDDLTGDYNELLNDFNELDNQYYILTGEHAELENDYDNLLDEYNTLQNAYDAICLVIRQSILPVQYSIFAEAVRRYYKDIYIGELTGKDYWLRYAEFCRDIILHDSWQENSFGDVSDAFSDALKFGDDTMYLANYIMYLTFYPWLPNWGGFALTGNELTDIDIIIDWCIDEIEYEYDSDITYGHEYFDWDYIKFPVETAFRTMGDCEDQAILCSAYLESCGFETAIAISHDPDHPTLGAFYHGHLLVHIEDTSTFNSLYPSTNLWSIGGIDPYEGFTWCWLDTTWDVPFGSTPTWLSDYGGSVGWDILTIALCDIDGTIGDNI